MQYYKVGEIRAGTQRSLESLTGWKGSEDVLVSSVVLARDLGQIQIPGNPRVVPSTHTCNFKRHLVSTSFAFRLNKDLFAFVPKCETELGLFFGEYENTPVGLWRK